MFAINKKYLTTFGILGLTSGGIVSMLLLQEPYNIITAIPILFIGAGVQVYAVLKKPDGYIYIKNDE